MIIAQEKIIIVDDHDAPISTKLRNEVTTNDIYRVVGLWVVNSRGDVLLAQRKLTKKHDPGKWGSAAAGTIAEGETYESCAYKELQEELGIADVTLQAHKKVFIDDLEHRFFVKWFKVAIDRDAADFAIEEEEVEQVAWIKPENLRRELRTDPGKFTASASRWAELFL